MNVGCQTERAFLKVSLEVYNHNVLKIVGLINDKKEEAQKARADLLLRELSALKILKHRHDPKINPLCDSYLANIKSKDALDKNKEAAKSALDSHAGKMITEYETTINRLLKGFGAGFKIGNSRKTYIGGTPTSAYQILQT